MTHGDLWEQISGGMRDQSSPVLFYLVLGGGFIAVLVITLIIFRWWTSKSIFAGPFSKRKSGIRPLLWM